MHASRGRVMAPALLLLLAPVASAAPGSGTFTLQGGIDLPRDTTATLDAIAFLAPDTSTIQDMELTSPLLRWCQFDIVFATVGPPGEPVLRYPIDPTQACFPLSNVTVRLRSGGEHAGWLGGYPEPGGQLSVVSTEAFILEPAGLTILEEEARFGSPNDSPQFSWYYQTVAQSHVRGNVTGSFHYSGAGAVKVKGPDLAYHAAENSSTFDTGKGAASPAQTRERWATLEFQEASFLWRTETPVATAAKRAALSWDGAILFQASSGAFHTPDATYTAKGSRVALDGTFTGSVLPLDDGRRASLAFSGDLRDANLAAAPVARPPPGVAPGWLGVALVVGLAVGAGGLALVGVQYVRRVRARALAAGRAQAEAEAGFDVEHCIEKAQEATAEERHGDALMWVRRARALSPTSHELVASEAFALWMLGDLEESLKKYREAHEMSPTGHHAWVAAQFLEEVDAPAKEIFEWLERALETSPEDWRELDSLDFPKLQKLPEWAALIRRAQERERRRGGLSA